jgi:hypothetical protein
MSADKKGPGGKEYDESQRRERGPTGPDDSPSAKVSDNAAREMKNDGQSDQASGRTRARNQDVLPGILGKQLRAAYGELLNAPVPDAFTDLIKRLESKDPGAGPPSGKSDREEESGP